MKIYTRTGDAGTTGLFGGDRVEKSHPRIEAYGTVDETNSMIGLARAHLGGQAGTDVLDPLLARVQDELFILGADLATPSDARAEVPRISRTHASRLESDIDTLNADLPPLKHFILPGGTAAAAALHVARTVCRRAGNEADVGDAARVYLNRLSDFLFVAARWANHAAGVDEAEWKAGA